MVLGEDHLGNENENRGSQWHPAAPDSHLSLLTSKGGSDQPPPEPSRAVLWLLRSQVTISLYMLLVLFFLSEHLSMIHAHIPPLHLNLEMIFCNSGCGHSFSMYEVSM